MSDVDIQAVLAVYKALRERWHKDLTDQDFGRAMNKSSAMATLRQVFPEAFRDEK